MGTRAFIGFKDERGKVFATTVQFDGGYNWLGAEALQGYIQTDRAQMKSLFEKLRWVDFPFSEEEQFEDEPQLFLAKYNRKGRVILDILKTKDLEKANLIQKGEPMDVIMPEHLRAKSNIEQQENGEWIATFQKVDITDGEIGFEYGYLYNLADDTLEMYSFKRKEVKTDKPVLTNQGQGSLIQTICVTRDVNARKLLKLLRNTEQVEKWYKEKTGNRGREIMWEEDMLKEMDFLLKSVVKEKVAERKIFRLPIPAKKK